MISVLAGGWIAACGSDETSVFDNGNNGNQKDGAADDGSLNEFATGDSGNGIVGNVAALAFEPPVQTLTLDGVTPGVADYRLKATLKDGSTTYVTAQSLAFERPDLASFTNGDPVKLTAYGQFAGSGKLHAIYGGAEATAELKVLVHARKLNGVNPTVAAALDAAGLSVDPSLTKLRYPYDKTVFPLGLKSPLVMWNSPKAGDVYRLHVEQGNYTYDEYQTVPTLGQFRMDQAMWDRLTASNDGSKDGMKVVLSRHDGTKAYTSATETWTIAPASLRGAIYYWRANKPPSGDEIGYITRIRPGVGSTPEIVNSGYSGSKCMGCHAVSADGSTLAASVHPAPTGSPATSSFTNGWLDGRAWASFNLPEGTLRKQTAYFGGNLALTPDGKYTVFGGKAQAKNQSDPVAGSKYMTLGVTATGAIIANSGLDQLQLSTPPATNEDDEYVGLSMPAFSPGGTKMAAVEFFGSLRQMKDNVLPVSNQIVILSFNQATTTFAPQVTRLPLGTFTPWGQDGIGYPSFTPDNGYVAFHVGNHSTGCYDEPPKDGNDVCNDLTRPHGMLWIQKTDGVAAPIHMANADTPPDTADPNGGNLSVEPTFNPIQRGGYSWAVFTSMREWGNKNDSLPINNGKRRLWVTAIDGTIGTADPSHPAFYIEGQEDTANMRGFWTLAKCTDTPPAGIDAGAAGACQAGFECCSGFCDRGKCVDPSVLACKPTGGTCAISADCCNGGSGVTCQSGVCKLEKPK
jgi:hypothetical protein